MFLGIDFLRVWCGFLNFSVLSGLGFLYLDASHSFGIGILLGLVWAAGLMVAGMSESRGLQIMGA